MGIPTDEEYLQELREEVVKFLNEIDEAIERAGEENIERHQFGLVRNVLIDLEDQLDRQEFIHKLGPGTRTFRAPYDEEDAYGNTNRRRKMIYINQTIFRAWGEATSSYIAGNYYAATITISAALEAVLKHEIEKEEVDHNPWKITLDEAVSKARHGDIVPHNGEVSEAADRIVNIRNNIIHFNFERGLVESPISPPTTQEQEENDVFLSMDAFSDQYQCLVASIAIVDCYTVAEYIHEQGSGSSARS
ncbi:hypothetical protein [Halorubrum sp. DM2]|uniref:hypothetical protein n=1 Tax=Halorubrum sp. DM2 TaxID=2527867 RepID=UPI0024B780A0|nr:hypothetical protein [Halorubrum sp. DM2]